MTEETTVSAPTLADLEKALASSQEARAKAQGRIAEAETKMREGDLTSAMAIIGMAKKAESNTASAQKSVDDFAKNEAWVKLAIPRKAITDGVFELIKEASISKPITGLHGLATITDDGSVTFEPSLTYGEANADVVSKAVQSLVKSHAKALGEANREMNIRVTGVGTPEMSVAVSPKGLSDPTSKRGRPASNGENPFEGATRLRHGLRGGEEQFCDIVEVDGVTIYRYGGEDYSSSSSAATAAAGGTQSNGKAYWKVVS